MNRFRTKKKGKDAPEGSLRVSTESEVPSIPIMKKSRTFGRSKKHEPEPIPEPELDVANALPPSDDFRTSLLMSGLSARFSMLREQDDPTTKIGKASDDSVLFPKRLSRFNDLNFQSPYGLSDIAEVQSINGSIRPPFMAADRKDSYSTLTGSVGDDDSIHSGSIMSRAKPGEGNSLFGGRQKVYKLPGTSGSSKSLAEGGMSGRTVYDHDVSQSAFQKLREKERDQERERAAREESEVQSSRPPSPPLSGYNRNRETSSTTSSAGQGNTRTSTAGTSISSQRTPSLRGDHTPITPNSAVPTGNLEKPATKTRRLYETGLDQHLHEQQHSAMSRIDTLSRQRNVGTRTPPLNSPVGTISSGERWERAILSKQSMPNLRPTSPMRSTGPLNGFDFAVKSTDHPDSKSYGMASPPLSPPVGDHDNVVVLPVQPNDRGKATATGAFSRPWQPYDENKYSQRQVQMQQGRETPPLRKQSPPHAFVPRQQGGRSRAESNSTFASANSGRSRSNSSAQRRFLPAGIPEIQPPKVPENQTITGTSLSSPHESVMSSSGDSQIKTRTSLVPLDLSRMNFQNQNISLERPDESQHPAHRQVTADPSLPPMSESNEVLESLTAIVTPESIKHSLNAPADSPTLGPTTNITGLSGMVRQHLRSDSNTSSVYGAASSGALTSRFPTEAYEPISQDYYSQTNPWDSNDGWDRDYYESGSGTGSNQNSAGLPKEQIVNAPAPTPLAVRSPNAEHRNGYSKPDWEKELESHHTRDGSAETQKERLDFQNELAERRKRVQENLKSMVENDSRASSPVPEATREPHMIRSNPLGLLKSKTSRGSLAVKTREPPQSKAIKMLGIGNATISSSPSPNQSNFGEDVRNQPPIDEESAIRAGTAQGPGPIQGTPPHKKDFRQARRDAQRDRERQTAMRHQQGHRMEGHKPEWGPDNQSPQRDPARGPGSQNSRMPPQRTPSRERPPPITIRPHRIGTLESQSSGPSNRSESSPPSRPSRDRSSSNASQHRSKSRNGKYKDDLTRAMAENGSSSSQGVYNELGVPAVPSGSKSPNGVPLGASPIPSPMMPSPMMPSPMIPPAGRSRSNSRAGPNPSPSGYFDHQKLAPIKVHEGPYGLPLSPRPSPTVPYAINTTPAQPSPGASAVNTPTLSGFSGVSAPTQTHTRSPAARKRSINKHEISEPKFLSSTSRITTVDLPPEASLQNGMDTIAPPIPPVNPARRQTRGMFGLRKKEEVEEVQSMPAATQSTEEMSTFSDDGESKPRTRQKLRKSSSEGGNLNARARQAASVSPTPAMPTGNYPASRNNSPPRPAPPAEGGMF